MKFLARVTLAGTQLSMAMLWYMEGKVVIAALSVVLSATFLAQAFFDPANEGD